MESCIEEVGEKLANMRRKSQLTQQAAADWLGITVVYLSYIENGRNTPSFKLLGRMAVLYGTKIKIVFTP